MADSLISPELRAEFDRLENLPVDTPPPPEHWRDHLTGINGKDPMSPYVLPESMREYKNITDVINHKGFLAYYPQSYTPVSNYFRDNNITPYFNPTDSEDYSKGMLTIAGMVELLSMGQSFEICRDQDFDEILAIAKTYVKHASAVNTPEINAYVRSIQRLINEAEVARQKIFRRHNEDDKIPVDFVSILRRIFGGNMP